jgi:hypothetical protein
VQILIHLLKPAEFLVLVLAAKGKCAADQIQSGKAMLDGLIRSSSPCGTRKTTVILEAGERRRNESRRKRKSKNEGCTQQRTFSSEILDMPKSRV